VQTDPSDAANAYMIPRYLALVCIMGEDSPAEKKAIIDYNVGVFQAGLKKVFPKSDREAQVEIVATNDESM
jgi:Ras-related GTP-binding protein C/D